MDRISKVVLQQNEVSAATSKLVAPGVARKAETLPFTIKVAKNFEEICTAVEMRRAAYGRHVPEFAESIKVDHLDSAPGTIVLLAQSRLDGRALGTLRVQTNDFGPLALEESIQLPNWLKQVRLAEATRLGVAGGAVGRLVKVALCKAFFMYCAQNDVDWMLITARSPLDREYESMLFRDVFSKNEFVPMKHVGGMPHRIMAKPVAASREGWKQANHPLYAFFCETDHVDIDVSIPVSSVCTE